MGEKSEVQFCDATWNPWQGCIKVSPGCKFCYMYRDKEMYGQNGRDIHRSKDRTFRMPLRLKEPSIVFTCSWSDWFIEEADEWRPDAWKIVRDTPQHRYLIFTKRSERINDCLPDDWGEGYENVMLVATAENQKMADKRGEEILHASARYRGLSLEPLLGPIDISRFLSPMSWDEMIAHQRESGHTSCESVALDWLVIGGESGNENGFYRYRQCEFAWLEDLINQGTDAGVAVFFKQFGTHLAKQLQMKDRHGGDQTEFPPEFKRFEFPPAWEEWRRENKLC